MITEAYLEGYMNKEALSMDDVKKFYNNNETAVNAVAGGVGSGALAKLLGASNGASALYGLGGAALAGGGTYGYNNRQAILDYLKGNPKVDSINSSIDKTINLNNKTKNDIKAISNLVNSKLVDQEDLVNYINSKSEPDTVNFNKRTKDLIKSISNLY